MKKEKNELHQISICILKTLYRFIGIGFKSFFFFQINGYKIESKVAILANFSCNHLKKFSIEFIWLLEVLS